MYIGTQGHFTEDHDLEQLAQLGVNNIDITSITGAKAALAARVLAAA